VSEQARRNLTRGIVGVAIVALIVFAYFRKTEIPRLVDTIANATPAERLAVVQRLIAKEKLAEAMEDAPRWVQYNCVQALAQIGDHAAMAQMLEAKWDFDEPIEKWCETLLVAWDESAVGPLVEAIQDKDSHIRAASIVPLSKIGEPAKAPLLELTGAWDQYVRDAVRDVFAKADMAPLVREELIDLLKEREPRLRETPAKHLRRRDTAVRSLEKMTIHAYSELEGGDRGLITLLSYEDADPAFQGELRGQAAASLGNIANQTKDSPIALADAVNVIDPLIGALSDPDWTVRRRAAEAVGPVCEVTAWPDDPVQQQKLEAPVEPLISLLSAEQPGDVRAAAAESLGRMGSIRAAAPLGVALASDAQRQGAAQEIALALERIGADAVPELAAALHHGDPDVRELATRTLANIGGALARVGKPAVSQLINAIVPGEDRVNYTAAEGLANIGSDAVPELLRAIIDHAGSDRAQWAAIALGDIGSPAVPALMQTLHDDSLSTPARANAARALGLSHDLQAIDALLQSTKDAIPAIREQAIRSLADLRGMQAETQVIVSGLGESVDEGDILKWLKQPGDAVEEDEPLVQVQIDKGTVELSSPATGAVARLLAKQGQLVRQGQAIAVIGSPGEAAVIDALGDRDAQVREAAMRVLQEWPGVVANEGLARKLEPPNAQNTRRRAAVVIASHFRAGMLLGMAEEATQEQRQVRELVASLLESALGDATESQSLRRRALELSGSVVALEHVDKETIHDPASASIGLHISPDDIELTHAACKALASVGARVSREVMREARVGLTPEPSEAATILAGHLDAPETPDLVPWFALSLAEVRDTAVKTLVDPGSPDDPVPPKGLLMEAEVPTQEQLAAASKEGEPRPTIVWAAAVIGRIGKPAVDAMFDARGKLGGLKGVREQHLSRLQKATRNYDIGVGIVMAALKALQPPEDERPSDVLDRVLDGDEEDVAAAEKVRQALRSDKGLLAAAEEMRTVTRRLQWLHAAMSATRDTLARDFVDNVGEYDLLHEDQYRHIEEAMDELARLKVTEW